VQGKADKTFLDVSENIVAFEIKIKLLIHRMESGKIAAFLVLNAFAEEVEIYWRCIRQIFLEHLTTFLSALVRHPFSPVVDRDQAFEVQSYMDR